MKILQIIQRNQLRGAEIFACQLSEEMQQKGHQVDVLILFGNDTHQLTFSLSFIYLHAIEKRKWMDVKGYYQLAQIIKNNQYDVVQANAGDTLKYASISKKIFRWKSILVFRNANKSSDFLTTYLKRKVYSWLMKEIDFVASVSKECLQDFIQLFPSFQNNTFYLPIGIKTSAVKKYTSLADIGIQAPGPYILHVGSFMPEKNHHGLIRIFIQLLNRFPNAKLILIGEGKMKENIIQEVSQKNLNKSVYILGSRQDVLSIMGICDILVLPSLIEGLPGVIMEAFSQKLPVVAYDTGGIKELVTNNETGWLVPKNHYEEFVHSIEIALNVNNEDKINKAFDLVSTQFAIKSIADQFLLAYQKSL